MAANGFFLSDEQWMIRDMARDFAANELSPHAGDWDLKGGYPEDILPRMGKLGLMGMLGAAGVGRRRRRPRGLRARHGGDRGPAMSARPRR